MLADDLSILNASSFLWTTARPLLDAALRLEQHDDASVWYGWTRPQLSSFLNSLPTHCTLVVGVWEALVDEKVDQEQELLVMGCVCEVVTGEVHSIRTFDALDDVDLPPIQELEPGFEHANVIMHAVKAHIAPVAWALFTDKATWDEWLFTTGEQEGAIDKSALLAAFARQGRCVLLGSQAVHHHSHQS